MVRIDSLDQEGRGITRVDGKVVFVEGALPGELVEIEIVRRKRSFDLARVISIVEPSSQRVEPRCRHYERCGGCKLQHLDSRAQVAIKQRVLEEDLKRIGNVRAQTILPALHGPNWGYRHRARFAVRHVARKNGALVGFHERRTHLVVDMDSCEVVPPVVSAMIVPLRALISATTLAARIPQIEIAVGDATLALALRVLDAPSAEDLELLRRFALEHGASIYLQPGGPDSMEPLQDIPSAPLYYTLPEFGVAVHYGPSDFTQVNPAVNGALVHRALSLLDVKSGAHVADLFCGVGNFSLAMARCGVRVTAVEGSAELVARARDNAVRNGLGAAVEFRQADLFREVDAVLAALGPVDALLIDPPRDGAYALVNALRDPLPARIVYVSCNPATLARDAGVLVAGKGYALRSAGVVNMFPHTAHVESIALFERESGV